MSEQFNGTVRVKDGNKSPMDYGVNREVEVSISFFTETESKLKGIATEAANVADTIVNEKLGRTSTSAASADKPAKGRTSRVAQPPVPAAESKVESAPITTTAPTTPAPPQVPDLTPTASGQQISTGEERVDPASSPVDIFSSAPAPEINDAHMMSAITRINGKYKGQKAAAIRELIGKYVPQDGKPHQAVEIEKAKRQAFLTELETV